MEVTPRYYPNKLVSGLGIANVSFSVATIVSSTLLILARIIQLSPTRAISGLPGNTKIQTTRRYQPWLAVEIIIESAALYSVAAIMTVIPATDGLYADMIFANVAVS
jgi:hypothetical protein